MSRPPGVVPEEPTDVGRRPAGTDPAEGPAPVRGPGRRRLVALLAVAVLLLAGAVGAIVLAGPDDGGPSGTATAPSPEPPPVVAEPGPDPAWQGFWAAGDVEALRGWFGANTGPTVELTGPVPGGEVRSQADADRLRGRTVTSGVTVDCDCVLEEFTLVGADLWIDGGDVTVRNVRLEGDGPVELTGALTVRGDAEAFLSHVEIVGHHDGIRAYAGSVTAEYVFVHDVAERNPRGHHQDGVQVIAGAAVVDRSFVDMTGANTSAVLVKPDAGPIPYVGIRQTVLMGGSHTLGIHDGPRGAPQLVEISDTLVAPGYRRALVSIWDFTGEIRAEPARVAGSDRTVELVDGAAL